MPVQKKISAGLLLIALVGCGQGPTSDAPLVPGSAVAEVDASVGSEAGAGGEAGSQNEGGAGGEAGETAQLVLPAICATDTKVPPTNLVCTGLYADIAAKRIASGIEPYTPAVPLWSDGAQKQRWVSLPAGQIDNSNPNEWSFPVGTKFWKEFSVDGSRIETRLWQKTDTNYWVDTTYAWNKDESGATRSAGGDISLPSRTYHIPTGTECTKCHRGRTDRILGFDQVLMGMSGASGFTIDRLVAEHRLTNPPHAQLVIGDDGTGYAAPALAWLHVNCGTTCHNRNSDATAYSTGLFLRLDPTELDGRPVTAFDSLLTTEGVTAVSPDWKGQTRITPGNTAQSLLYQLISHRGTGLQMPPIGTSLVDTTDIALVEAWVAHMPISSAYVDAGTVGTTGMADMGAGGLAGHGDAPDTDASLGMSDAGMPIGDASLSPIEAGTTMGDASLSPVDAGSVPPNPSDAGAAQSDASLPTVDAGVPPIDASEAPPADGSASGGAGSDAAAPRSTSGGGDAGARGAIDASVSD